MDAATLPPGTVLADRYRVVRHIGSGAFGVVILVEDVVVHEEIILKFLKPHVASDEQVIKRFVQELRYARRITHENVIRIHDFIAVGRSYAISMEYFPGFSLAALLARGGPLPIPRAFAILQGICRGMSRRPSRRHHPSGPQARQRAPQRVRPGEGRGLRAGRRELLGGSGVDQDGPDRGDAVLYRAGASAGRQSGSEDRHLQPRRHHVRDAVRPAALHRAGPRLHPAPARAGEGHTPAPGQPGPVRRGSRRRSSRPWRWHRRSATRAWRNWSGRWNA